MRFRRSFAALLLGLPLEAPIAVAAEDVSLAPEVQRRVLCSAVTSKPWL